MNKIKETLKELLSKHLKELFLLLLGTTLGASALLKYFQWIVANPLLTAIVVESLIIVGFVIHSVKNRRKKVPKEDLTGLKWVKSWNDEEKGRYAFLQWFISSQTTKTPFENINISHIPSVEVLVLKNVLSDTESLSPGWEDGHEVTYIRRGYKLDPLIFIYIEENLDFSYVDKLCNRKSSFQSYTMSLHSPA